jgi:cytoskeletal protein RodZ
MTETPVDVDVELLDEDDEPEQWLARRPRLMGKLSWVLLGLLVAAGGFAAGAALKRPELAAANTAALRAAAARAFGGGGTGTGTGGFGGGGAGGFGGGRQNGQTAASTPAAGDATVGQVKLIDGANVYVQTSAGDVVKIATTPTTPIEITTSGSLSDLQVGDTLSVAGTAGADGTVAATSISRTAAAAPAPTSATPTATSGPQG